MVRFYAYETGSLISTYRCQVTTRKWFIIKRNVEIYIPRKQIANKIIFCQIIVPIGKQKFKKKLKQKANCTYHGSIPIISNLYCTQSG